MNPSSYCSCKFSFHLPLLKTSILDYLYSSSNSIFCDNYIEVIECFCNSSEDSANNIIQCHLRTEWQIVLNVSNISDIVGKH